MNASSRPIRPELDDLARAARDLAGAPADERGWRLRRLLARCAALAAAGEGVDALDLAHDAWRAALDATAPPPVAQRVRPAPPAEGAVVLAFRRPAGR